MNIIDRRPNPKGKSLPNRQRFLERAKHEIKDAMTEALKRRKVGQNGSGEKVSIPSHRINEPVLRKASQGGKRDYVVPGNKEFVVGDRIKRPPSGGDAAGGKASPDDGGEQDSFEFVLTREEFLNLFFDDLELPDLIKTKINDQDSMQLVRAGYSVAGSPSALSVKRTMRNSFARRISLNRPTPQEIAALKTQVDTALAADDAEAAEQSQLALDAAVRKSRRVPYIDPVDVRYNRFERIPKPNTQAVMFCLMDVSGSMTEQMKDLAKRFFMLLHVFLTRRYKHVDIVFIRHTSSAQEVDEDTFFHSRETGGTIVSTALDEMMRVVQGALQSRQLEHLCGPGVRRRQLYRGQRPLRLPDVAADPAGEPVLRLHRGRRRGDAPPRLSQRADRSLAHLRGHRADRAEFRHAQGRRSLADLPGLP